MLLNYAIQHNSVQKTLVTWSFNSFWRLLAHQKIQTFCHYYTYIMYIYGDAQDCEIYTPMLWYDRIKFSNSIVITHLAPFSMVGPKP
jgi:hypothetical protein